MVYREYDYHLGYVNWLFVGYGDEISYPVIM